MTAATWRTVGLGLVLALLVVPFGGPYVIPGLLVIGALVAFDLWRQSVARDRVTEGPTTTRRERTLPERLAIAVGALVAVVAVLWVLAQVTR